MNKKLLFVFILSALLIGSISYLSIASELKSGYSGTIISTSPNIDQTTSISRPILVSVKQNNVDVTTLRSRNDTLGEGGIFKAGINVNVTIQYKVVNYNTTTGLKLFLDMPGNYSFSNSSTALTFHYVSYKTENITLPYDKSLSYTNVNVSYYEVTFNLTDEYAPFYAAITDSNAISEIDNLSPINMITTLGYWKTKSLDKFYIQTENATINLIANDTNPLDNFGISYKLSTGTTYIQNNFTLAYSGNNATGSINLGKYNPGITIIWYSIGFVNDNVLNQIRQIDKLDIKSVDIGDGTPTLAFNVSSSNPLSILHNGILYSQTNNISLQFQTTIPKGNITQFELISNSTGINSTILPTSLTFNETNNQVVVNGTIIKDFQMNKISTLSIIAKTDKSLQVSASYIIIIDNQAPIINNLNTSLVSPIKTITGFVPFNMQFNDNVSKVRTAVIDFGDGISSDVTNLNTITHHYFNTGVYTVILRVTDWAGNVASRTLIVDIKFQSNIITTKAPNLLQGLILLAFLALVVLSPFYIPQVVNLTRKLLRKE